MSAWVRTPLLVMSFHFYIIILGSKINVHICSTSRQMIKSNAARRRKKDLLVECNTLKVRSHQTQIARMIYMLSQCKDARMRRRELREFSVFNFNRASWKIWTLADIRAALTNQELALAVTSLRAEGNNNVKSETTMEGKVIVVVCGYPELYIHLPTFTKTGIHFATRLELPGRSPSHDANSRLLCSEFHARMKRVNSKCSSVQLRANSAIYSRHSRLVWTHLQYVKMLIRSE